MLTSKLSLQLGATAKRRRIKKKVCWYLIKHLLSFLLHVTSDSLLEWPTVPCLLPSRHWIQFIGTVSLEVALSRLVLLNLLITCSSGQPETLLVLQRRSTSLGIFFSWLQVTRLWTTGEFKCKFLKASRRQILSAASSKALCHQVAWLALLLGEAPFWSTF